MPSFVPGMGLVRQESYHNILTLQPFFVVVSLLIFSRMFSSSHPSHSAPSPSSMLSKEDALLLTIGEGNRRGGWSGWICEKKKESERGERGVMW